MKKPTVQIFQFPNIPQIITEVKKMKPSRRSIDFLLFLAGLILSFLLLILIFKASVELSDSVNKLEVRNVQRNSTFQKINFWQNIVNKYSRYPDGFMALALLEYRVGDKTKATLYAEKAIALNPNSSEAKTIRKMVEEK